MIKSMTLVGLVLSISACSYNQAGEPLDESLLGASTRNNAAMMSGEDAYAIQLATRFAEEVPTTINFAFDDARLDGEARAVLDRQASWIKQFPEVRFRVYGHTDSVGSSSYNKRLGLRRARAAVNHLVSRGISRNRLEAMVSQGESQPLILTQQAERRNRRTVTEVSGFLKRHPTVLDGKYAQIIYRDYVASAVSSTTLTSDQALNTNLE
ncbi:OmpA family protein [Pseudophaeobacter profundi]|uniref:OmpA family protein n=1 Tax=Pseudophaeobacter profundi TaxID=3034152 RepID=UPI002431D3EC|nr:OmpA family protein [Pseudophaeobacter profundi]